MARPAMDPELMRWARRSFAQGRLSGDLSRMRAEALAERAVRTIGRSRLIAAQPPPIVVQPSLSPVGTIVVAAIVGVGLGLGLGYLVRYLRRRPDSVVSGLGDLEQLGV